MSPKSGKWKFAGYTGPDVPYFSQGFFVVECGESGVDCLIDAAYECAEQYAHLIAAAPNLLAFAEFVVD